MKNQEEEAAKAASSLLTFLMNLAAETKAAKIEIALFDDCGEKHSITIDKKKLNEEKQ